MSCLFLIHSKPSTAQHKVMLKPPQCEHTWEKKTKTTATETTTAATWRPLTTKAETGRNHPKPEGLGQHAGSSTRKHRGRIASIVETIQRGPSLHPHYGSTGNGSWSNLGILYPKMAISMATGNKKTTITIRPIARSQP